MLSVTLVPGANVGAMIREGLVAWCTSTVSNPVLKPPLVSALETIVS
jgi:hypothetical protein